MKNIHKKIGAIALAGIIVSGGLPVRGLNIQVAEAAKAKKVVEKKDKVDKSKFILNEKDLPKYKDNIYNVQLPKSDFARKIPIMGLLDDDENPIAKEQMKDIEDICKNSRLKVVKLSSEANRPGMNSEAEEKRGIDAYLDGLEVLSGQVRGIDEFLKGPQLYFDDVSDLKFYLYENSEQLENGFVRLQVQNIEGVFVIGNGRAAK